MRRASLSIVPGLLVAACGHGGPGGLLEEPPVLTNAGELDADVVARIEEASELVRADPADAGHWADLGMVLQMERMRQQALVCYEQALARRPDEPRWWYWSAALFARLGNAPRAIAAIEKAIELEPSYAPAHYRLGTYHLEMGELAAAFEAFQACTEVDPEYPGGWVGMAKVHLQRDESRVAIGVLEPLLAREPDDAMAKRLLVSAYRQAGLETELDAEEVVEEEGEAWDDPWQAELREVRQDPEMRRVGMLLAAGEAGEVVRLLEAKRAENPDQTDFLPQLAEAYFQLGRTPEARETYRVFLDGEPRNVQARMALARMLVSQEMVAGALERLDQVIEIQPAFAPAYEMKGKLLYDQLRFEEALAALEKALEYDQRNPGLRLWVGFSLLGLSRWEEALPVFERVLEDEPGNGDAYLGIGKALMKLRRLDEAEAALRRAEELGTEQPQVLETVRESLARTRERLESGEPGDGER